MGDPTSLSHTPAHPQRERAATGLDTGCVYGGRLTACVLPPVEQLVTSDALRRRLEAGEAPTLDDLQGEIVSVPAARAYAPKKDHGADKAAAGAGGGAAAGDGAVAGDVAGAAEAAASVRQVH